MSNITKVTGNLLTNVKHGTIVHGCNDQGKMGAGFALALKNMYPEVYQEYVDDYHMSGLRMGAVVPAIADTPSETGQNLVIFNAITQHLYKDHPDAKVGQTRFVSYDAVADACLTINDYLDTLGTHVDDTLHFPMIGAGYGGGDWKIIESIFEQTIKHPMILWVL